LKCKSDKPTKLLRQNVVGGKTERIVFLPDVHSYDHDPKALSLARQITEAFKPTRIIWLGDVIDAWWATPRFIRKAKEIKGACARELEMWDKIRKQFKAPHIQVIPGNHDARVLELRNHIEEKHPELLGTPAFDWLDLAKMLCPTGEEYVEAGAIKLAEGEFTATHGIYTGPTACKREMLRWGTSGISGHDHGLQRHYQRDSRGTRVWVSAGHLELNPPRYHRLNDPAPQTWIQGMAVGYFQENQFDVDDIPFSHHYKAMLNGKRYSA